MEVLADKQLSRYVTMRIGGTAKAVIAVHSESDVIKAVGIAHKNNLPLITIGSGSNIIFSDKGFDGIVLINKITGLTVDGPTGIVKIGAGVIWDEVVQKTIDAGLCGIESLANIPSTAGASPINNIGAYGQEIKNTLAYVRAYDTKTQQFVEILNKDCAFKYRDSRFKSKDHGRFIITEITLQLSPTSRDYQAPNYPALQKELEQRGIKRPLPRDVQQAVIAMRKSKLPDLKKLANVGSFFKNPCVSIRVVAKLLQSYPDMPHFKQSKSKEKLSAGWLIEQAGLKNLRQNGIWIYDKHALTLVNESAQHLSDLLEVVDHIKSSVKSKFGVKLELEPEII